MARREPVRPVSHLAGANGPGDAAASMVSIAVCPLAPSVSARQARVGVVTNVEGMAPVARVALPQPQPLWFKDDVFLKDQQADVVARR